MYDGGVPEQLIQETTGNRSSDGVRAYKCISSALKREASEILQGSRYTAREVKALSPEKCDQKDSNQLVVVSTNSTRIVIS